MMRCPSGLRKREAKERSVQNCNDERLSSFLAEYILDLCCLSFCAHADVWHGARRGVLPAPEWEGEQTDRSRALWSDHLLSGYQIPRFILFYYYTSTNACCSLCLWDTQFVMHWNICPKINFLFRYAVFSWSLTKAVFIACFPSNNHNNLLYINIRRVNHVKRNNNLLYKCSLSGFILSSNTVSATV